MNPDLPETTTPEVKDVDASGDYLEKENLVIQQRLERAWRCVIQQYQDKSRDVAISEGEEGMCIFRFLFRSRQNPEAPNCEFYWAEKNSPPWTMMVDGLGAVKAEFLKAYRPGDTYVICVSIPMHTIGDETVQSLKIFEISTGKEVEW